ncbi:MAG: single-stranded-DNA-specific exonuclease RecJ [Magnetococcales bacterium]|nr:single-stranded-DNA-specific exonuclease RecJ [Magnetococcales bacterium]
MGDEGFSFLRRRWRMRIAGSALHESLCEEMGLGAYFAPLLAFRKLDSVEEARRFFMPRLQDLVDPSGLKDMDAAVARLIRALEKGEKLAVFGDYDVDGATSSALLVRYFRLLGVELAVYIPDRMKEGYGPNAEAFRILKEQGVSLIITVDCGISAHEPIRLAAGWGLDCIVTDHHQPGDTLPDAVAVINPNRKDDSFPCKELAGVGVAFYLAVALNRALRETGWFADRPEPDLKRLLDLVAVGTIADVASLTGLNRLLVASGLRVLSEGSNTGLRAMMERLSLPVGQEGASLDSGMVGFQIGPRINAGGRLGRGDLGSELLYTEDAERAREISAILDRSNQERKQLEEHIFQAALQQILDQGNPEERYGLTAVGEGWHPGVVGIVASRLAERFCRPTIIISLDAQGIGKGSGRSIPGIDLYAAIGEQSASLIQFGGHVAAAGLTITREQIATFCEGFERTLRITNPPDLFESTLVMDGVLPVSAVGPELLQQLQRLQPFGRGNPEPVFLLPRVRVVMPRNMKERHVGCQLCDESGNTVNGVAFRCLPGPLGRGLLTSRQPVDVVGTLRVNRYRERDTIQMVISDARPASTSLLGAGR